MDIINLSKNCAVALQIMKDWQWQRGDPDGNLWPIFIDLNEVICRLALEGTERPQDAVLSLLRNGHLLADGNYHWRKSQDGHFFNHEGTDEPIKSKQWKDLIGQIINKQNLSIETCFSLESFDLPKLGLLNCSSYEWEFSENRFSFAICFDKQEEWFSAWNITVTLPALSQETLDAGPETDNLNAQNEIEPTSNRAGRKPKNFWPAFAEELAFYLHENGPSESQNAFFEAVASSLIVQKKPSPGRTQGLQVISALYRRLGLSGNS